METQTHKITYKNKEEIITQYLSESNEQFAERLKLIQKLEQENMAWKDAHKLSKIYYNVKYKKCKYPPIIYHNIKKYL
jgi:hypothetical protein